MKGSTPNGYSAEWFETFLYTIDSDRTEREISFLTRHLPLVTHPRILDLCCGAGRHAHPLAQIGYEVTGVDRNEGVIARARCANLDGAIFVVRDVREIGEIEREWDGVLIMWASFGFFSPAENRALLTAISRKLRVGGRLVLDIYNPDFFRSRQGEWASSRGEGVMERKWMSGSRLFVELRYPSGGVDLMSWETFQGDELEELGATMGLESRMKCCGFDEGHVIDPEVPRMQFVFERVGPA